MHTMTWDSLFGRITGVQNKRRTLANAKWVTCTEDTWFNGCMYAAGSKFKYWEGKDFGYVCFHSSSRTPDGNIPGRFIHKY